MGIPILVLGESGSGKTSSLRNFKPEELEILNVASKPLPFRSEMKPVNQAGYRRIYDELKEGKHKRYIIDDSQYLLSFELFARAKDTGYEKFTDMALHFYNLIKKVMDGTGEDTIVYFLHHTQQSENGIKIKTVGKMLDEKLTLEGLFSVVLITEYIDGKYCFRTQTNGNDPVKTPIGMFADRLIENDLKLVDKTIREYWNLK